MAALIRRLRQYLRSIPLFGGLIDAKWIDHREAIAEIVCGFVFSTMPIWLGTLVMMLDTKRSFGFWGLLVQNVERGELFILAAALFGPLIYIIYREIRDNRNARRFPSPLLFLLLPLVITAACAVLFGVSRAADMFDVGARIDGELLFRCSAVIYASSVVIIYLAHVYRNFSLHGAPIVESAKTADFVAEFTQRNN